jgi:hypothetical protein
MQFLESALEFYTLALFTRNGWNEAEVQALLAGVQSVLKNGTMHLHRYWYGSIES